ncbi:MAG: hypothetical protein ACI9RO_001191 [Alteromonas macleodii]|jgi:hypothetical protein
MDCIPIWDVQVQVNGAVALKMANVVIIFATDIPIEHLEQIMLEELKQTLWLMTDIRNLY